MGKTRKSISEWIRKKIHKRFTTAEILETPHLLHEHVMVVEGMPGDWAVMTKLTASDTPYNYWVFVSDVNTDGAKIQTHDSKVAKFSIKTSAKEAQVIKVKFIKWLESIHLNRPPTAADRVEALEEAAEKALRKIDYLPGD